MRAGAPLLLCAVILLAGCEGAAYLGQAALGHARLVAARRPVESVIADAATPQELRAQLQRVQSLRGFAQRELGMRDVRGFDSFVATGRSHAVWNVVAAPEFSLTPLAWCFPVAGCVSYRGYFSPQAAQRFAARLASEGHDTHVYGVAAYSTLGWFDDPVLDTWAMRRERALAALVFHEFAHQLVYAPDDTAFSEGFARVVEREGVRRWLHAAGRDQEFGDYLREQETDAAFAALLARTRERLAELYAQGLPAAQMRERKQALFARLREEYDAQSRAWPAGARFDAWMAGPLDNARLAASANYDVRVPALQALLAAEAGELPRFYAAARVLAELDAPEREARLAALDPAPPGSE